MRPDDETLVRQCLEGDRDAFASLIERYERPVYNASLRMLGDPEDARDATQTVFLKAFQSLERFDARYRFYSWLYRIAINESIDALQRRGRYGDGPEEPVAPGPGPEASASRHQTVLAVRGALMRLRPDHRAVILLRHYVECSYREMADILDIPEKTVKSRLFSARQALRDLLVRRKSPRP